MAQVKRRRKVMKALAKGQITIPSEFREALGIKPRASEDLSGGRPLGGNTSAPRGGAAPLC